MKVQHFAASPISAFLSANSLSVYAVGCDECNQQRKSIVTVLVVLPAGGPYLAAGLIPADLSIVDAFWYYRIFCMQEFSAGWMRSG